VLSETESANPQTTPKLSWPSLRTTRDVIGKARYKDPSPVTIRLPFPIFGWQTFAIPSSSLLVSCVFFFRLTPLSRSLFLSWELGRSLGQPTLRLTLPVASNPSPLSSAPLVVITATTQATYVSSLFTPNSTPHHRHITFLACASLAWLVAAPFLGLGLGCCSRLGAAKKPPTGLQRRLLVQYQYLCWGPCAAAYPRGSGTEILDHHSDHCHQTRLQTKLQLQRPPSQTAIEPRALLRTPAPPFSRSFLRRSGVHAF
jgi:hypothetical protein